MRIALVALLALTAAPAAAKNDITVTWIGHATFEVVSPGGTRILIDPFIKDNPAVPAAMKDLSKYKPAAILVSHSHPDHAADAVAIAKASGAKVVGIYEYIDSLPIDASQKLG